MSMRINLHHLLEHSARAHGSSPALTYRSTTLSYAELWQQAIALATGLRDLKIRPDDRVAIFLEKRIETVAAIFGTSASGGVFVPVNPHLRPKQVAYILADCGVRLLITSRERLLSLRDELRACPTLEHIVLVESAAVAGDVGMAEACKVHSWTALSTPDQTGLEEVGKIDVDMAAILYTSGSTGKPKGVVLSHRNLIAGAESVAHYLANSGNDVILAVLPLSFDAGLSQLTTGFSVGAHVVLMNYLVPSDVVRLCAKHAVTGLTCVPPLWIQIADQPWPEDVGARLRYFANTGGRMPKSILTRLRSLFPAATPYLMYGLTEAFRSTYLDPAEIDRRPDSIGKAIPNTEILVVRSDGSRCAPGEEGELVHRGALVAMGYWNDPARTAERFRPVPGHGAQPWRTPEFAVFSGDTVTTDEDGFLYFVGRKDEMIKTSGYRVSPTEIEEAAYDTGLVRDAVALGVEDPKLGQRVVLVVSPADGRAVNQEALLAAMRQQLPLYMMPTTLIIRDSIPRSPNGKFDRALLRAELAS
jgi:acyl-CoA ligase (AMP-forming) (exosortase A-associated)